MRLRPGSELLVVALALPVAAGSSELALVQLVGARRPPSAGAKDEGAGGRAPGIDSPPFVFHGSYSGGELDHRYPITNAEFAKMPLEGNCSRLLPMMRKLAAGGTAKIIVLGGSMTDGAGCEQPPYTRKDCAWSARLASWLRAKFPRSQVQLDNRAQPAAPTAAILGAIGVLVDPDGRDADTDLVILDTLVNDASAPPHAAYEKLIRALHHLLPHAVVFGLLSRPEKDHKRAVRDEQLRVLDYYGLPRVDFAELVERKPELWRPYGGTHGKAPGKFVTHPEWTTHQLIADVIANMLGRTWAISAKDKAVQPGFPAPLGCGAEDFGTCLRPLTYYGARHSHGGKTALPAPQGTGWRLYEDRPGKPGWIAERKGSKIRFPLRFGRSPTLLVTYLRSYEALGKATLKVGGLPIGDPTGFSGWKEGEPLDGLWADALHGNTSQAESLFLRLEGIAPDTSADVEAELVEGPKFKLLDVVSC